MAGLIAILGVALFILLAALIDLEMEGISGGSTLPGRRRLPL